MNERKSSIVDGLSALFKEYKSFYLVNISGIPVNDDVNFRKKCFEKNVVFVIAKNSLIKKALGQSEIDFDTIKSIESCLKCCSGLMLVKEEYKVPAELIYDFQKECPGNQLTFKCAYIEGDLFLGQERLKELKNLKSRTELIADIVFSLTNGVRDLMTGFQGVGDKIYGIVKSLEERS